MPSWTYESWILQFVALVLIGGGTIAGILFLTSRRRDTHFDEVGIPGNLPDAPGINISQGRLGGDAAGLIAVVGIIIGVAMLGMWSWFLAVAVAAVLFAIGLFLWHRFHPW